MAKKNILKLSESKLQEMVIEAVKSALNENFFTDMGDKFNDFAQGYPTKEGNPQSIEDLFEGDGWQVVKSFNKNGATYYAVKRMTGSFGVFNGQEDNDMVEELNIYLNGNGTASYVGTHPKYKHIELFKINF